MDIRKTLQDAAYVTVGLGVVTFQQAQVRRRETTARIEDQAREARRAVEGQAREARRAVEGQAREARRFIEARARDARDRAATAGGEVVQLVEPVVTELRQRVEPLTGQVVEPVVGELRQRVEPWAGQLQTLPDRVVRLVQHGAYRFQRASASTN
ncbi:MAG TPA: hypothetical protein VFW74_09780 [Acidimicrobiia bacterium]|nr:hypothetical protein [Acidimicrobiia bacterium]